MAKSSDDDSSSNVAPELEAEGHVGEVYRRNLSTDDVAQQNLNTDECLCTSDDEPIFSESDDGSLNYTFEKSDESASRDPSQELEADLAAWVTRNKCTRSAANELLVILRKQGLQLPKDARTLSKTPRTVEVVEKCGGKYLYMGLKSGISKLILQNEDLKKKS